MTPKVTKPQAIKGRSVGEEINIWLNAKASASTGWSEIIDKAMGEVYK